MKAPIPVRDIKFGGHKTGLGGYSSPMHVPDYCDIELQVIESLFNKTTRFVIQDNVYISVHLTTMFTFNVVDRKLRRRS